MSRSIRAIRKMLIGILGFTVLVLGILLIPLPGPGLLVVLLGLIILSYEFEWADRWRQNIKKRVDDARSKVKRPSENMNKE